MSGVCCLSCCLPPLPSPPLPSPLQRCDVSSRLIHQTFAQLRAAVDQREECLLEQLERVRSSAGKMLEERQETSAHLKVLGEQLLSHARGLDSNHIRAQMKVWWSGIHSVRPSPLPPSMAECLQGSLAGLGWHDAARLRDGAAT